MTTRNVIIGGGPAGLAAIETIREIDGGASSITLISDEPPYARMALPYLLAGDVPEAHVMTGGPRYYDELKVHTLFGKRVENVFPGDRKVALSDGSSVEFDNLLVATGSVAQRLNIPGADQKGVTTLWTLADAHQALNGLPHDAEVVFVGAGFIGFIILNAFHKMGKRLSVVEVESHVLPRMLDARGAGIVERWLSSEGARVITGQMVAEIGRRADGRKNVRLSDGRELSADLVVLATGIRPRIEPLQGASVKARQGILVNDRMQTNFETIYAAGDCAEGPELLTGEAEVHAIQPTAIDHGRIAGANMAGQEAHYPGSLLMNILDVCGLQCVSYGMWQGNGHETDTILNVDRPIYQKLVWDDDRLVGATFVGRMKDVAMLNDVGMVKGFIQSQAPLGHWKGYIQKNPADLRRPYIGAGIPARLLEVTTLGRPSRARGYRFRNAQALTQPGAAHAALVGTKA
jgi:NAD(P)H-nitrite reductase large subunit